MGCLVVFGYPAVMAAKNKSKGRKHADRPPDVQEIFALHFHASRRQEEIVAEAKELQKAGKLREARALLKQAKEIGKHLKALEDHCKGSSRSTHE